MSPGRSCGRRRALPSSRRSTRVLRRTRSGRPIAGPQRLADCLHRISPGRGDCDCKLRFLPASSGACLRISPSTVFRPSIRSSSPTRSIEAADFGVATTSSSARTAWKCHLIATPVMTATFENVSDTGLAKAYGLGPPAKPGRTRGRGDDNAGWHIAAISSCQTISPGRSATLQPRTGSDRAARALR